MKSIRKLLFLAPLFASAAFAQIASPFLPQTTVNIAVTASAQTLAAPQISNPGPLWQYVITSTASPSSGCTQPTFFTVDGSTATSSNGAPVLPNSAFLISVPKAISGMSVIGAGVGCTLYVTVGVGQ
jgi:hypothetical protein